MPEFTVFEDRTGHKIEPMNGRLIIEVIARSADGDMYVLKDTIKGNPEMQTGAYFLSKEELEDTIVGFETGNWE